MSIMNLITNKSNTEKKKTKVGRYVLIGIVLGTISAMIGGGMSFIFALCSGGLVGAGVGIITGMAVKAIRTIISVVNKVSKLRKNKPVEEQEETKDNENEKDKEKKKDNQKGKKKGLLSKLVKKSNQVVEDPLQETPLEQEESNTLEEKESRLNKWKDKLEQRKIARQEKRAQKEQEKQRVKEELEEEPLKEKKSLRQKLTAKLRRKQKESLPEEIENDVENVLTLDEEELQTSKNETPTSSKPNSKKGTYPIRLQKEGAPKAKCILFDDIYNQSYRSAIHSLGLNGEQNTTNIKNLSINVDEFVAATQKQLAILNERLIATQQEMNRLYKQLDQIYPEPEKKLVR